MTIVDLADAYGARRRILEPILNQLVDDVENHLLPDPMIDRIYGRVKTVEQFVAKARKLKEGRAKYADPLREIQDQIGLRVIVKFESERDRVSSALAEYLIPIERAAKQPDEPDQFGYEATHLVCLIPEDMAESFRSPIEFLELQVCTLFQHAWAEANHDVGYKAAQELSFTQQKMRGLAGAHAWGADQMFERLRQSLQ